MTKTWACAVVATALVGGGCNFGESGIAPPANRVFLPTAIAADPHAGLLYVANSNSDLRFNAGTVVAVDLQAACCREPGLPICRPQLVSLQDCPATNPPVSPDLACTKTRFSRTEAVDGNYCCRDLLDSNIVNCNEPQFIQAGATVSLGSFASAMALQSYPRDPQDPRSEEVRRLFVAVRAEPSITFADVTVQAGAASIRCTGNRSDFTTPPPGNPYCDDNWRLLRPGGVTPGALVLPEEPHVLSLDAEHGMLFIGHLTVTANAQLQGGGVSTVDVCNPTRPDSVRFAGLARNTFLPQGLLQAVAALSPGDPSVPDTRVYAGARYSAAISGLALRNPSQLDCSDSERDLTLVSAESFLSPAFLPRGTDIRGVLFSAPDGSAPQGRRAFVLYRNDSDVPANPPAIAVLDRTPLTDGTVANTPLAFVEVCSGPTAMQWHNAGRGDLIYVTCYDDGQIDVVDPVGLTVVATIDAGVGPTSLVFAPQDPTVAYVASYANSHLSIIDLAPDSPTENRVVLRIGLPHGYGE